MRWVVCHPAPDWSVGDVFTGWCEGLRDVGQHVAEFNLGDQLVFLDAAHFKRGRRWRKAIADPDAVVAAAYEDLAGMMWKFRPHVLMLISGFFVDTDVLDHARRLGIRVVILHTESPFEDDRQIALAPHADLNLVNDPVSVARFETVAPTVYAPHAYRPAVHHPGPPDPDLVCDLAFAGTGFLSRVMWFEAMAPHLDGLDVRLAGNWLGTQPDSPIQPFLGHSPEQFADNADVANLYRSMRAGINLYRREANTPDLIAGAGCGPREIEMAACGAFFLRDPRPEGDRLFPMLPTFTEPAEAATLLRWYLAHDDERRDAALKAREAVAGRTFTAHAAELLRLLGIKE